MNIYEPKGILKDYLFNIKNRKNKKEYKDFNKIDRRSFNDNIIEIENIKKSIKKFKI